MVLINEVKEEITMADMGRFNEAGSTRLELQLSGEHVVGAEILYAIPKLWECECGYLVRLEQTNYPAET